MKKIIYDTEFNVKEDIDITKHIIGYKDSVLMAITTNNGNKSADEFRKTTKVFIPVRYGRKKEDKFYLNEAAKFISGNTREHNCIYLIIKDNLDNLLDAIKRDEFLHETINDILILDSNLIKEDSIKEVLKPFKIIVPRNNDIKYVFSYLNLEEHFNTIIEENITYIESIKNEKELKEIVGKSISIVK